MRQLDKPGSAPSTSTPRTTALPKPPPPPLPTVPAPPVAPTTIAAGALPTQVATTQTTGGAPQATFDVGGNVVRHGGIDDTAPTDYEYPYEFFRLDEVVRRLGGTTEEANDIFTHFVWPGARKGTSSVWQLTQAQATQAKSMGMTPFEYAAWLGINDLHARYETDRVNAVAAAAAAAAAKPPAPPVEVKPPTIIPTGLKPPAPAPSSAAPLLALGAAFIATRML